MPARPRPQVRQYGPGAQLSGTGGSSDGSGSQVRHRVGDQAQQAGRRGPVAGARGQGGMSPPVPLGATTPAAGAAGPVGLLVALAARRGGPVTPRVEASWGPGEGNFHVKYAQDSKPECPTIRIQTAAVMIAARPTNR
jgi:hypothetical protein